MILRKIYWVLNINWGGIITLGIGGPRGERGSKR